MTTPRRFCFGVASRPLTESTREKKQGCVSISRFQSESQRSAARRALAALGSTAGWKTLMPEAWSFSKSFAANASGSRHQCLSLVQSSVSRPSMSITVEPVTRSMARVESSIGSYARSREHAAAATQDHGRSDHAEAAHGEGAQELAAVGGPGRSARDGTGRRGCGRSIVRGSYLRSLCATQSETGLHNRCLCSGVALWISSVSEDRASGKPPRDVNGKLIECGDDRALRSGIW